MTVKSYTVRRDWPNLPDYEINGYLDRRAAERRRIKRWIAVFAGVALAAVLLGWWIGGR